MATFQLFFQSGRAKDLSASLSMDANIQFYASHALKIETNGWEAVLLSDEVRMF